MPIRAIFAVSLGLATSLTAVPVIAQDVPASVRARQGLMQLQSLNLGVVANMARGNIEYDAEAAQAAADNLVTLSRVDQRFHWPEGTDSDSIEGTRALPAIWADMPGLMAEFAAFAEATAGLAAVAGDGAEGLGAAVGRVGQTCGSCHDAYRVSN